MARPQKQGLDYFPLDVDFFSDKKIKILKASYGADGISLYIYLLCEIYKNGYFLKVDADFEYIVSADLGMDCNKVRQVLNFLLKRSLFDNTLFQLDKVLTSTGIQKRFQLAVKERAKKKPIEIKEFWLLEEAETESFIKVHPESNKSGKNNDSSGKNDDNSLEESLKERKVEQSIVKERKEENALLPEDVEQLVKEFDRDTVNEYIERTTLYHCCNALTIRKWITEDRKKSINRKSQGRVNKFNNFPQREMNTENLNDLERRLLSKQRGGT